MAVKISKSDLVAEKLGIIYFCINCVKRISITNDEADYPMSKPIGDENLWIHDETQLRCCYPNQERRLHYAFPRKESRVNDVT